MDAGCLVAWQQRFNPDELSAVQHAMNLKCQDEAAFFAEYQNEPMPAQEGETEDLLEAEQIAEKLSGIERGRAPIGCTRLTAFIDVMDKLLFWAVCGWEDNFTGYVIDYGTFPDQRQRYFTQRDARRTMQAAFPTAGLEGQIRQGLDSLTALLLSREWRVDGGGVLRISRCLVDANYSTDIIYAFCRASLFAAVLLPAHGRFVGARSKPFHEYQKKRGDRVGLNWRMPRTSRREVRHISFDSNFWKTFVHNRLTVALGDAGCLSLYGAKPDEHRLLADHLVAEYRVKTEGRGRVVDEWQPRPNGGDNHWLDCLAGCAVAAAFEGAALEGTSAAAAPVKKKIRLSDLQRQKRMGR
jgi:hypothetical protein